MNHETFARNLRQLRQEKGITQEQLAEQLGVSAQSVSRWECGNTLPDVMLLPNLARFYGITVDDLYKEQLRSYKNYAQRLLAVYENTGRTEDFLLAEQEYLRLLAGEHTADDLRSFGVLYHYMTKRCAAQAKHYLDAAMDKAERSDWVYASAAQQRIALLCDLGQGGEAVAQYQQALAQDDTQELAWLLCVVAHYFAGGLESAHGLVDQALEKFPDSASLCTYAGDICKDLGRYEEAFSWWSRTMALAPDHLDVRYAVAFCYEELGEYAKALATWTELHKLLLGRGLTQESQLPARHISLCREKMD